MMRPAQFRHERKYLVSMGEKEALKSRLKPLMATDPHATDGVYIIRSLYFDDYFDSAYEEKNMGVYARSKYRIRFYDYSDRVIKLERKLKRENYIFKEDASLTREEVERILNGDVSFCLTSPQPLLQEFYCEYVSKVLRPRVLVDYDREPFLLEDGTVRVTFDLDLRVPVMSGDIFDPSLPVVHVMDADMLVMEVKFTEFLPQVIRQIVPPKAAEISAVSKYVFCCERTAFLRGYGYYRDAETHYSYWQREGAP
ncbi:MAG: polyphosphate polymerase domain-containing protein [Lachnospiraceae bacterium]|nr:polyphosphate polymerase domain-containing protein [Lachnospiraceae bacterium]